MKYTCLLRIMASKRGMKPLALKKKKRVQLVPLRNSDPSSSGPATTSSISLAIRPIVFDCVNFGSGSRSGRGLDSVAAPASLKTAYSKLPFEKKKSASYMHSPINN